jgi:hypothetical protein
VSKILEREQGINNAAAEPDYGDLRALSLFLLKQK